MNALFCNLNKELLNSIQKIALIAMTMFIFVAGLFLAESSFADVLATNKLITNYRITPLISAYDEQDKLLLVIRQYDMDNQAYSLVVDPENFITSQKAAASLSYRPLDKSKNNSKQQIEGTKFSKTLKDFYQILGNPPTTEESMALSKADMAGLKRALSDINGVFLTVDMCPSARYFEKAFFENLIKLAEKDNKSIPVAISMTGLWMIKHDEELAWLVQQPQLSITWINHSFNHLYYRDVGYEENFLNLQGTNVMDEILTLEQELLKKGLTPSVFFRFPGLVSDHNLLSQVLKAHLIPISSEAWLAKGEQPTAGSIILVHGNSNEPIGIEKFMEWSKDNQRPFLPLNEAFTYSIEPKAEL
jgi:hypothetical protein